MNQHQLNNHGVGRREDRRRGRRPAQRDARQPDRTPVRHLRDDALPAAARRRLIRHPCDTSILAAALVASSAIAADFGTPGGPEPTDIDAVVETLRRDPYDLELLISFGTSKGGSAGHLALAVRDGVPGDDLVYSANFYADRVEGARHRLLHRQPDGDDPEEGVPVPHDVVAGRNGVVRTGLRRDLQALGHRHPGLRRAGEREAGGGGLLPAHQRRLPPAGAEHRVPRRRGQVRLPAAQLREDDRFGLPLRRGLQGPRRDQPAGSWAAGASWRRPTPTSRPRWR